MHHPDGRIHINDVWLIEEDFLEEFPEYTLEGPWTGQEYVQGKFHRVFDSKNEEFLDKDWKDGDEYIKKYKKIKNKKEKIKKDKEDERKAKYEAEVEASRAHTAEINKVKEEMNDQVLQEIENKRLEREEARLAFENDPERIKEEEDYEKWVQEQKGLSN